MEDILEEGEFYIMDANNFNNSSVTPKIGSLVVDEYDDNDDSVDYDQNEVCIQLESSDSTQKKKKEHKEKKLKTKPIKTNVSSEMNTEKDQDTL